MFGTPLISLLKCIQVTASRQISFTHGSRAVHFDISLLVSWIQVLTIFNYPRGGEHSQITLILGQMQGLKNCSILSVRLYYQRSAEHLSMCPVTLHALLHLANDIKKNGPPCYNWSFMIECWCG